MIFKSRIRRNIEKKIAELTEQIAFIESEKTTYVKNPNMYVRCLVMQKDCQKKVDMLKELL